MLGLLQYHFSRRATDGASTSEVYGRLFFPVLRKQDVKREAGVNLAGQAERFILQGS